MPNSLPNKEGSKSRTSITSRKEKNLTTNYYLLTSNKSSAELRTLVHNFDFANPDLLALPDLPDLLKLPSDSLTPYEQGLLTAIKLAYLNSEHGKVYLRKKAIKAGGIAAAAVAVIVFAQLTITSPAVNVVKSVAAATMSAILR